MGESEELALGSIGQRDLVLDALADLRRFPVLSHQETIDLVRVRRLWGRGLSAVDMHLLGSAAPVDGASLWSRDERLIAVAQELGLAHAGKDG